jgi:pilus assembly protein CpaF
MSDGSRKITQITEVANREGAVITMQDIFVYKQTAVSPEGKVIGQYCPTGSIPDCLVDLHNRGLDHFDLSIFSKNKITDNIGAI